MNIQISNNQKVAKKVQAKWPTKKIHTGNQKQSRKKFQRKEEDLGNLSLTTVNLNQIRLILLFPQQLQLSKLYKGNENTRNNQHKIHTLSRNILNVHMVDQNRRGKSHLMLLECQHL